MLLPDRTESVKLHLLMTLSRKILLNSRINQRVLLGEHFVRPDIVEQRYMSSLKLLDHYFDKPDVLELFDNSKTMTLMAEIRRGQLIMLANPLPEWVTTYLGQHIKPANNQQPNTRDLNDLDAVRRKYGELKKK